MKKVSFALLGLALSCLAALPVSAQNAQKEFVCSAWFGAVSRSLFTSSGLYATSGSALNMAQDCQHTLSGFYINFFESIPVERFRFGSEIDIRVGNRFKLGEIDIDASAAWYNFGVKSGTRFNSANARIVASKTFVVTDGFTVKPYVELDYQRIWPIRKNDTAAVLGVVTTWDLAFLPLTPKLAIDWAVWKHVAVPVNRHKPIYSASASLGFKIPATGITIGPMGSVVFGGFDRTGTHDDYKPKYMIGAFASATW